MKPLVSVVIPTYNRAELLKEAINSVLSQEGLDEDFAIEVIVVDDASVDATSEIVIQYPQVKYIRLAKNSGVSCALNAGIKASAGKYVAFLDDDDLFLSCRLKSHIPFMEAHPELGVVYSQFRIEAEGQSYLYPLTSDAPSGFVFREFLMKAIMFKQFSTIRMDAFFKAGLFDESLRSMEDYDMFLRLAFHVPFQFIPGVVAVYRFSSKGLWFTETVKGDYIEIVYFILDKALAMLPEATEAVELKRKAYLSWLYEIIYGLKKVGKIDYVRNYLLETLAKNQWKIEAPWEESCIVDNVANVGCMLAFASSSPLLTLKNFLGEVRATNHGFISEQIMKQILAKVWIAVGGIFLLTNPPRYRKKAGYAAIYAVFNDPPVLIKGEVWKLLIKGIFANPRWDPFIHFCKRLAE